MSVSWKFQVPVETYLWFDYHYKLRMNPSKSHNDAHLTVVLHCIWNLISTPIFTSPSLYLISIPLKSLFLPLSESISPPAVHFHSITLIAFCTAGHKWGQMEDRICVTTNTRPRKGQLSRSRKEADNRKWERGCLRHRRWQEKGRKDRARKLKPGKEWSESNFSQFKEICSAPQSRG